MEPAVNALWFVLIPVYRFIVYPLARIHIPSLLKMIGAGLIVCFVSIMINTGVTVTVYFSHNTTMIDDSYQAPLYWRLVVDILNGLGTGVTIICSVEFVMAQTPNRMRGIMMGALLTAIGWSTLGSYIELFKLSQKYTFYFYLVPTPLAMLFLTVFVIFAKRYKLRERERHVNIQVIVEEHYERYFEQEEEYMRECCTGFN